MSASQPRVQPPPHPVAGVSMRDLLASCAAADAVSKPPREPEPRAPKPAREEPAAA
ncbi:MULTISPECIES: hypothetical protein [Streptomyces]|uniref:hypothetical protein n=1 Tax=Streptomyces TaxID=1883 RepID=UPI00292EDFF5|nr:hypothetical protein [Streptomyces sp. NEAU-HV9]